MRKLFMCAVLLLLGAVPGWAETVGVPVGSIGSSTPVGNVSADGTINFYIPLKPSASSPPVYGVGGVGTSPDSCYYGFNCGGGTMAMYLRFTPVQTGNNILSLAFSDLDLFGSNDPNFFLESVGVFYDSGTQIAHVDNISDPEVVNANYTAQLLQMQVNVQNNPFFVRLNFASQFTNGTFLAKYVNTVETLRATVESAPEPEPTPLPEPATISLLGLGLLALGLAGRSRRD
jgi:hypothetical protein